MNKIIARYVSDYDSGKRDGSGRVLCPFCGEAAHERDIEKYSEVGTDRSVELCTNCREGFERDLGLKMESDTLPKPTFDQIWDELPAQREEPSGLNEATTPQVAEVLGGEAWQSGGGIWLVLLRRQDGRLVVLSDDAICEYADDHAFEEGQASHSIVLR